MIALLAAIGVLVLVALVCLAAIIGLDEYESARKRRRINSIVDPFTERETRKLVSRYRQEA